MNKLMPLEFKNQRIIITKILAEEFGASEKNINDNFSNNHTRFIEDKHYFKLEGQALKDFKNSLPDNIGEPLKFAPKLILWTDRGAARHAKILDTDEAWEVYEALEESYFNPKQQKQLSPMDQLKLQYQVLEDHEQKIDNAIERIGKIENNTTIDYSQQEELRTLGTNKVIAILGGTDAPAYKELNKKAFSSFWRDYKRKLRVNSYRNTLVKDFETGRQVIIKWQPSKEVAFMISGCNAQMRM